MAAKWIRRGGGILASTLVIALTTAGCRATKPPITHQAAQTALHNRAPEATPEVTSQPNSTLPQEQRHAAVVPVQSTAQPQATVAVSQPVNEPLQELVDTSTNQVVPATAVSVPTPENSGPAQLASHEALTSAVIQASLTELPPEKVDQQPAHGGHENGGHATIELCIENVRPGRGAVKVAVFTDAESFLQPSKAANSFQLSDSAATVAATVTLDQPAAIAVFQDIDGNGQLTRNRMGMPVEPCAFSNNATIKRGPPKFSEALIQPPTASEARVVTIMLP